MTLVKSGQQLNRLVRTDSELWIKICGITTEAGLDAAIAAQVDAVGFVFHPSSKRWLEPARAARLAARVPQGVLKVAVTLHPTQAEVDAILTDFTPDLWQTDLHDLLLLRLPSALPVLPVLRSGQPWPAPLPPRFLFEGPVSGVGAAADWSAAIGLATRGELILAGGLHPGNVAQAVTAVRPFGVDVSSGVEGAPGIKDPQRIDAFVRAARSAGMAPTDSTRH